MAAALQRFTERHIGKAWIAAIFAFLYLPLGYLVLFSFNSTRQDTRFTGFSLRWYEALFNDSRLVEGFLLSLRVAMVSATLSAVLGTLAAFVLVRYKKFPGRSVFSGMINAPLVMPEVIIGLSLLLMMVAIQRSVGWPDRGTVTIVFGHTLLGMAYGAAMYALLNAWALPLAFGDPAPWRLGFDVAYPSLVVHLVYGAVLGWLATKR